MISGWLPGKTGGATQQLQPSGSKKGYSSELTGTGAGRSKDKRTISARCAPKTSVGLRAGQRKRQMPELRAGVGPASKFNGD